MKAEIFQKKSQYFRLQASEKNQTVKMTVKKLYELATLTRVKLIFNLNHQM